MRRLLVGITFALVASFASASATPIRHVQTPTEIKLQQLELQLHEMIANHGKLMATLHRIEASLDAFQNSIHAFRMKLEKK